MMHVLGLEVVNLVEGRHSRQKPAPMHNIQRIHFNVKSVVQAVPHGSHEKLPTGNHLEVNDLEVLADQDAFGADTRKPFPPGALHGAGSGDDVLNFVVRRGVGESERRTEGRDRDAVQHPHISSPDDRLVGEEVKRLVCLRRRELRMLLGRPRGEHTWRKRTRSSMRR